MVSIKVSTIDEVVDWEKNLNSAGREAGYCQSRCWARIIQKVDHATPIFVEVNDGNRLIASLLAFHKIAWDRHQQRIKRGVYEILSGSYRGWLQWMDGPVFHTDSKPEVLESLEAILAWADTFLSDRHLSKIIALGFPPTSVWSADDDVARLFREHGYTSRQTATYLVDLQDDKDKIWHNLKHAARQSIAKARKAGLVITKIASLEQFKEMYYIPYVAMERSFGRTPNPWITERMQWEENKENLHHYYVAQTPDGEVVATLGMYVFNDTATEIASSMSRRAFEEKLPAQDLIHWEMMLEAKKLGCHTFNLAGVKPHPSNSKEAGIRRFKEKWGGVYKEYLIYEKPLRRLQARTVHALENLYQKMRDR
ncbi:MAG: peptidoglycan bridge formation glycyltransferase FemA/FemB family protein [Ignavibacteriales bacterium]|nr:peptidoglycan bridge formation glycyltransferase FemA/FemB family protein [Ignavibacteriales bacterium]